MKSLATFVLLTLMSVSSTFADIKTFEAELLESNNGSKSATYNVGIFYSNGIHVKQNNEEAVKYFYKAALQNYAPAQNNLGWAFRQGLGIPKDSLRAVYWFRLAALQNNALALQNLAEMFQSGEGVQVNHQYAESLYTLCATQVITPSSAGREAGYNNAIHECRRELGKIFAVKVEDKEKALALAALWFRTSLAKSSDLAEKDETGVVARRSISETTALLSKIEAQLSKQSKNWIEKSLKSWNSVRVTIQDSTSFPLTVMDLECGSDREKI